MFKFISKIKKPIKFSFQEKKNLPKCKEIARELNNVAIENFPIYVVDNKGNNIKIKEIGFGENFGGVEIRLY